MWNNIEKLNKIIFNELVYILVEGIKILYNNVSIENITNNDIKYINKYFNSFGFKANLKIVNKFDINNLEYLEKYNNDLPNLNNIDKRKAFNQESLDNNLLIVL